MKITVLGSGTSTGVPQTGCTCEVCLSADARDKRLRCSSLVETEHEMILIDCGPDFREQSFHMPFRKIDGVLITHEHYDHVGGLDDLRPFCALGEVPVFAEKYTADRLMQRIPYCFAKNKYPGVPRITLNEIAPDEPFRIGSTTVTPIRVMHGDLPILGFRIGSFAYITDMKKMPESEYHLLENLDCLIVNALRIGEHRTHQSLSDALAFVERVKPREAYFVHMSHQIGLHSAVEASLPEHVHLAYDGLSLEVSSPAVEP